MVVSICNHQVIMAIGTIL